MKKGLLVLLAVVSTAHAGVPVWSFTPIGSPDVTVSATGTATVSYTVTNNSRKPHQLVLSSSTPAGITQSGGACELSGLGSTCTLTLNINGSALPSDKVSGGPILCQASGGGNQCYQPSPGDSLVITRTTGPTLSVSPQTMALSVNDSLNNPALTGNPRQITITNSGAIEVTGLSISYPSFPSGTTTISTCGQTMAAGATCSITITPGADATSSCNNNHTAPTPGVISVSASNVSTPVTINVVVLGYGCQYQGGFLYSVDDTTPVTGSIGGKVASLIDQAAPLISTGSQATSIIWSSNGGAGTSPSNVSYDIIPLIADSGSEASYTNAQSTFNNTYANTSTYPFPASSAFATCSGATDGQCNSGNILTLYDTYITGYGVISRITPPYILSVGPTNRNHYAAGLCTATINTYSDWYLPAICELDAVYGLLSCPTGMQSIVANLAFLIGDPSATTPSTSCSPPNATMCLAGNYWSSTELSGSPELFAWDEYITFSASVQGSSSKNGQLGVRCSRALTY